MLRFGGYDIRGMELFDEIEAQKILDGLSQGTVKGDNGRVLIVGGSDSYVGCLVLAATAAFRAGVDWVTIACPPQIQPGIVSALPDACYHSFVRDHISKDDVDGIIEMAKKHDVMLIGPGLGKGSSPVVKDILYALKDSRVVIDADGLYGVSISDSLGKDWVLTPNTKEKATLFGKKSVAEVCKQQDVVVLCKGETDEIYSKNKQQGISGGSARLTVAGTGDILAGLILGYMSRGLSSYDAACVSSFRLKQCSKKCVTDFGETFLPSELLLSLSKELSVIH